MPDNPTAGCPMPDDVCADCGYRCAEPRTQGRQPDTSLLDDEEEAAYMEDTTMPRHESSPARSDTTMFALAPSREQLRKLALQLDGAADGLMRGVPPHNDLLRKSAIALRAAANELDRVKEPA